MRAGGPFSCGLFPVRAAEHVCGVSVCAPPRPKGQLMFLKKYPLHRVALCNACIGLLLFVIVLALLNAINQAIWRSTESTIRSLTQASGEAIANAIRRDVQSLESFKESLLGADAVTPVAAIGLMQRYVATSPFSQVAVVNEQGRGYFADGGPVDVNNDEDWHNFVKDTSVSRTYLNAQGQRQVTMRRPLIVNGRYRGAVYGSLSLKTYAQPSAMDFFDGQGLSFMVSAWTGEYLIASPDAPKQGNKTDFYAVLAASPENKPERIAALRQAMNEGKSGSVVMNVQGRQTYLYYTPIFPTNNWDMVSMVPVDAMHQAANYVNALVAVVCLLILAGLLVMFSLTRRHRAMALEIKARHYRDFLFHTLSGSTDSVFLIYNASRRSMEYVFENLERVFGISMRACLENPAALFKHCVFKSGSRLREDFETASIRTARSEDCRIINPATGEKRWVKFSLTPKEDADGRAYYVISLSDITEEKAVRRLLRDSLAAAEQASRAKSSFLSAMSHDIRTPMNAVIGMAAIAERHAGDPARVRNCLDKISVASRLLLGIINEVLDMSKIESGKLLLSNAPFNLNDLIRDTLDLIRPMLDSKQHEFELRMDVVHPELTGDTQRIQQILLNLLTNAVKYTPDKGRISLFINEKPALNPSMSRIIIVVEDNGFGMSPEFRKRIFDSFARSDDERVHRIQGTGLGMPIVRNLVRMMHGSIVIESELNQGSRFTVDLALCRSRDESAWADEAPAEKPEPPERLEADQTLLAMPDDFNGRRILLVEDNALNMEIALELIGSMGVTIDCAETGQQAVERFKASPEGYYDLIFMDIQMPVMNGHDATRAIRALEREDARQVPIVAMSANVFAEDIQAAERAGMDGHLPKPIDLALLRDTLRRWL